MKRARLLWLLCIVSAAAAVPVGSWLWKVRAGSSGETIPANWPAWPVRPTVFDRDVARSEAANDRLAADMKATLIQGLRTSDWTLAGRAFSSDFLGALPSPEDGRQVPDGTLKIFEYPRMTETALDRTACLEVLKRHTRDMTRVERTAWRTFEFLLHPTGQRARFRLHFQVAGPAPDLTHRDFQATMAGEAVLEGGQWRLRRLAAETAVRLENPSLPFADATDMTGFHFNESEENRRLSQEIINERALKTAGGLSCFDANGDDFWDILTTVANRRSVLFLNDGHGGFRRTDGPGTRPEEAAFHFLVLDLDGDGAPEAVSTQVLSYEGSRARIGLYTLREGAWTPAPALEFDAGLGVRQVMIQALTAADADRDGRLDLFLGAYSSNSSGGSRFNAVAAYDGADNLLFINQGGLRLREESGPRGLSGTQYTLAAKFFDFDADGDQDLLECNDYGPNILWENDGSGRFRESKGHRLAADSAYTMGVSIADWDNTGSWSVYISNMYSHAGNRIVPLAEGLDENMRAVANVLAHGNQLFERSPSGAWIETSLERSVNWADWAWSCNFADFDNDSDKDLFVANGYTSHEDPSAPDW
jgi:hypothetical protein